MDAPMYFKCFICNNDNILISEGTSIPENNVILKSGARLSEVMGQILGYDITHMSDLLICRNCRQTCEEYDEINNRLSNIKNQFTERFRDSITSVNLNVPLVKEEPKKLSTLNPTKSIVLTKSKLKPLPQNYILTDRMKQLQETNAAKLSPDNIKFTTIFKTENQNISPGTSLIKSPQTNRTHQSVVTTDGIIEINPLFCNTTASSSTNMQTSKSVSHSPIKLKNALIQPMSDVKLGNPKAEEISNGVARDGQEENPAENYLIGEVEILEDNADDTDAETILMDENGCIIKVLRGDQRELLSRVDEISLLYPEESFLERMQTADAVCEDPISIENIKRELTENPKTISDPEARSIVERVGARYRCLICSDNMKKSPSTNVDASAERSLQRDESVYTFDTPAHIMVHVKTAHKLKLYVCDICGDSFRRKADFDEHFEEHNPKKTEESGEIVETKPGEPKKRERPYQCKICHNSYISKNILREHENIHRGNKPHTCIICNKSYANKYTYSAHLKTHSDRPRPFRCPQCSKTFYTLTYLMAHEKSHNPSRDVKCDMCEKTFKDKHNMEKHRQIHVGGKRFLCGVCKKSFARRCEVDDHLRTHTGERPFTCNICNKSFSQKANLLSHKRHTHTDDRRYHCEHCEKKFKRKRLLVYHMQSSHTGERPFECDACPATFVYPEHFKKHQRLHSGEKPYKCEVCDRAFNSRDNRNMHRYTHSEKKQFECVICGASFMRRVQLITHMNSQGHLVDMMLVNQAEVSVQAPVSDSQLQKAEESIKMPPEDEIDVKNVPEDPLFNGDDLISLQNSEQPAENADSADAGEVGEAFIDSELLNSETVNELLAQGAEVVTTDDQGNMVRLVQVQLDDGKMGWLSLH